MPGTIWLILLLEYLLNLRESLYYEKMKYKNFKTNYKIIGFKIFNTKCVSNIRTFETMFR